MSSNPLEMGGVAKVENVVSEEALQKGRISAEQIVQTFQAARAEYMTPYGALDYKKIEQTLILPLAQKDGVHR